MAHFRTSPNHTHYWDVGETRFKRLPQWTGKHKVIKLVLEAAFCKKYLHLLVFFFFVARMLTRTSSRCWRRTAVSSIPAILNIVTPSAGGETSIEFKLFDNTCVISHLFLPTHSDKQLLFATIEYLHLIEMRVRGDHKVNVMAKWPKKGVLALILSGTI